MKEILVKKRQNLILVEMTKMRSDVIMLFERNKDYFTYLRENPYWHKELSFNPSSLKAFVEEYKVKRRKRLVDKIEDLSMMLTLAKELM